MPDAGWQMGDGRCDCWQLSSAQLEAGGRPVSDLVRRLRATGQRKSYPGPLCCASDAQLWTVPRESW